MLRERHLVLDFDECLFHTFDNKDDKLFEELSHTQEVFYMEKYGVWAVKRPNLDEFLDYAFANFTTVSVWSAGSYEYVHGAVKSVFVGHPKPFCILTKDDVISEDRSSYCKPLSIFYNRVPSASPHNTILIDDRKRNFKYNPNNGILIPVFEPKMTAECIHSGDTAFLTLMNWFDKVFFRHNKDVRDFKKAIFSIDSWSIITTYKEIRVLQQTISPAAPC